jgi:dipeptidyl aminopeptidase/acylaminoacyl peptidase
VRAAILDPERRRVVGAAYYEHFEKRHYFDEADKQIHDIVRQSFPQFETFVVSRSRDLTRMIVSAQRDDSPTKYFWLDIPAKKGGAWFSQFPDLEGQALNKVTPIEFAARDGVKIRGYLTLPTRGDGKKPPLVVRPHGGPQSRDLQYFNPYVQLFANRGYAVLQVNFRGSTGFGSAFEAAGYRQWGGKMQEDVYDAIDWLKDQDVVNTDRACIVGASYGGYVALTAAFQKPGDFSCFVSAAGVSDLPELVLASSYWDTGRITVKQIIGDLTDNEQKHQLNLNSPIRHIKDSRRPILLIHGDRDTQVRITQSADFYRRAKSADLPVRFVELPFGTHYLDDNKNRLATFKAVDEFLRRHLD